MPQSPVTWRLEGPGSSVNPLFWVKSEETTEGRRAGRVSLAKTPPTSLTQGLDLPLNAQDFYQEKFSDVLKAVLNNICTQKPSFQGAILARTSK